ncbi:MAG TPA: hypothetical protein VNU64_02055 [Burkholderiales bacterium]|nr:hypothetical protein [Burkholderiales bacterium]
MYRAVLALLVLAGCATLTEAQCRAPADDWVALGEFDSIQGDQPWIEAYAKYCERYSAEVHQPEYMQGWDIGHAEFNRRANQTN